jgi:hypothetical protein
MGPNASSKLGLLALHICLLQGANSNYSKCQKRDPTALPKGSDHIDHHAADDHRNGSDDLRRCVGIPCRSPEAESHA